MATTNYKSVFEKDKEELWQYLLDPIHWVESFKSSYDFRYDSMPTQFQHGKLYDLEVRRWKLAQEWQLECHIQEDKKEIALLQKRGPFKNWSMRSTLTDHGEGQVLLTESISYRLPFSILGGLVDDLFLHGDLISSLKDRHKYIRRTS